MPNVLKVDLPSTIISNDGKGKLICKPLVDEGLQIGFYLNEEVCHYTTPGSGDLVVKTDSFEDDIVFDINSEGELIIISPYKYFWNISNDGDLILTIDNGIEEGIGYWAIEEDFIVS